MPRIRALKHDFFMDEETAALPPDAQLLLLALSTLADRDGLLEDRPVRIKAQVFPYRDVDVDAHLRTLERAGQVVRYVAYGKRCLFLINFARDQKPHPKETSLNLPPPPMKGREISGLGSDASRRVPLVVGCGSGSGNGSSSLSAGADEPEELPDATEHAEPAEPAARTMANAISLFPEAVASKPEKPRRKAEPRGDPRHAPLVDSLVKADAEVHGTPYGFRGGRDAKAVSECLSLADQNPATSGDAAQAEILRRWRIGRRWKGFPACNSLQDLATHWNAYARAQDVGSTNPRAPVRAESQPQYDPNKPGLQTFTGKNAL